MDLHTAGARPEWLDTPANERNFWQRLATKTNGILAPANVVTAAGLITVLIGIYYLWQRQYLLGLVLVALGRSADVFDGWTAHTTGTKSPFGEKFDATADKVTTGLVLLILPFIGLLPWWVAIILIVPQVVATVVALVALRRGIILHPSRVGKLGMATSWLSVLSFLGLQPWPHNRILLILGYGLLIVGFVCAFTAINGYRRTLAAEKS